MDSERNTADPSDRYLFEHPEVARLFGSMLELLQESDRGMVLIAACQVDEVLRAALKAIAPVGVPSRELDNLLGDHGPLSTLASRESVAVLCGLISPELGQSVKQLRRLRNTVAHSLNSFALRDHWGEIRKIFDFGPGVPQGINRIAAECLINGAVARLAELDMPSGDLGGKMFATPSDAIEYISEHPSMLVPFEEQLPRMELCIGTAMLCGLIIFQRDKWTGQSAASSTSSADL